MKEQIISEVAYPIRLGQFLKLINLAQDGIEAKLIILNGMIRVNGKTETRRGKQLRKNDVVEIDHGPKYVLK